MGPAAKDRDSPVDELPKVRGRQAVCRESLGRDEIADGGLEAEATVQAILEEDDVGKVMGTASMA